MKQIPVGVFAEKVSRTSRVFPGAGGKVDLGAVDESRGVALSDLEAMASECAVVVTDVGGLNDLVFDGYNGLKVRPDLGEVAHALQYLCQDKDQCKLLGQRARRVVETTFGKARWIEAWREQLFEVYDLDGYEEIEGEEAYAG